MDFPENFNDAEYLLKLLEAVEQRFASQQNTLQYQCEKGILSSQFRISLN